MYDYCGIGNACVDIIARVDDEFLEQWQFQKSICTYLELGNANTLESSLPSPDYIPGGCAANTAAIISALGGNPAFIGRVAADSIGSRFLDDMQARNIHFTGQPDKTPGAGSTRIFALITPDTQRTFAAYYGVQEDLSETDLDKKTISNSTYLFLDGYALNSRKGAETFLKAADISRKAGKYVVLSPSDLSILTKYKDSINALCKKSDMIICNEQEAKFLTQAATTSQAIPLLQKLFRYGAVTASDHGAYVFGESGLLHVAAATPPNPVIDTNGAGDSFAGGFLYGLCRGFGLEKSARLGNLCAAGIITHAGARPIHDCRQYLLNL